MRAGVLTISDRASRGERVDDSGRVISDMLVDAGATVEVYQLVPDDSEAIAEALVELADEVCLDLVVTTGGTGLGMRDLTPEATLRVVHRLVPGIPEKMRSVIMEISPHGMLSRAVAGVRGQTLIVNLPGDPRAVSECLSAIMPALGHAVELLQDEVIDSAQPAE